VIKCEQSWSDPRRQASCGGVSTCASDNDDGRLLPDGGLKVTPTIDSSLKCSVPSSLIAEALYQSKGSESFVADDGPDMLSAVSSRVFGDRAMAAALPLSVHTRFKEALRTGAATSEDDRGIIAKALFNWARGLGATSMAHWFFPLRGGAGAVGSAPGALAYQAFVDLASWSCGTVTRPMEVCLPPERLFSCEVDGSLLPNGLISPDLAVAYMSWDRGSPCLVVGDTLYVPSCLVTQQGASIDEKTPLLRATDAVCQQCLRLLHAMGRERAATACSSFFTWEQDFFVVPAALYRARPDLVVCGRTLVGAPLSRHVPNGFNYCRVQPPKVKRLLDTLQALMLQLGCPLISRHSGPAPGQHRVCAAACSASAAADANALFMQLAAEEGAKLDLAVLFHEKPFKGLPASGKRFTWTLTTDTGTNLFKMGKTTEAVELFVALLACFAYGLKQYYHVLRCAVAHPGNDQRLGIDGAIPPIISLCLGMALEEHIDCIIAGGPLNGLHSTMQARRADLSTRAAMAVTACTGDQRNRSAPFCFTGDGFVFQATGASQNCAVAMASCSTVLAAGMANLAGLLEQGTPLRDAVAKLCKENRDVLFSGNCCSKEWTKEASRRGLPRLYNTPLAARTFSSYKVKAMFTAMGVFEAEEVDARAELMCEDYSSTLNTEAATLLRMVDTEILPACARDLAEYKDAPEFAGERGAVYKAVEATSSKLRELVASRPERTPVTEEAFYLCDVVRPQMEAVRAEVDRAEGLLGAGRYPYPSYEALCFMNFE